MSAVTVADHRFRRRLRAGPAHLLRHRRDRHTPPDRRLGHQTTDLPGPPPARAGTGNGNGHRTDARSTPPRRQATRSPVTRHFRLRSQSRHGPLPAAGRPPDARDTDWSIPVIAGAGSVLARMFRYSAALSGARRHPPSRPPLPAGHWKGLPAAYRWWAFSGRSYREPGTGPATPAPRSRRQGPWAARLRP
jgi:hypothetical protein